jgi:RimJ/RimL family protein N-acetyltransferase
MFMRSERLFLRPGWPEDWQEVHAGIADEAIVRNLASAPWPYGAEDARGFAARAQDQRYPHFFITLPTAAEPARIIGCIGLDPVGDAVDLGYWIAREHWGRGYASEAARAVLELAEMLGHRRITASHFVDNPASGRVLRKLGFQPTGRTAMRHSKGRGGSAEAVEYALELDGCCDRDDDPPLMRAA